MTRSVLVLNAGSSSLKYALYKFGDTVKLAMQGLVEQIGTPKGIITHKALEHNESISERALFDDHKSAMQHAVRLMGLDNSCAGGGDGGGGGSPVSAVGHRVVHGGEALTRPALISEQVLAAIEKAVPLAPLHNPPNLQGIAVARDLFPLLPQVAVFDTAFHSSLPPRSFLYALPYELYSELGIRRYGFHGTSYTYLLGQTANLLGKRDAETDMIALHLGAGASMACIQQGRCIDTTMGVTPLEGLVMATRSGDIDPAIPKILSDLKSMSPAAVDALLNKGSGLFGICGEKDMKTVVDKAAEEPSGRHALALDVFVHRVRKYLGSYLLQLEGQTDAIVFSAGIGERSAPVRSRICAGLKHFGIQLDEEKNVKGGEGNREIQAVGSKVKIFVVPTDEELCIAQQTLQVVDEEGKR